MKIGLVIPWYGKDITGGAETEARDLATQLSASGMDVEVLTTCVKEFHSDWSANYYGEGVDTVNDIIVRRFLVRERNTPLFDRINLKLMKGLRASPAEERAFIEEMINSPDLYLYIKEHRDEFDFFIFIPYMFGTTFYGVLACPEKAIIIPCLHDESYAHMGIYREMFSRARGLVFLADAERELARRLYDIEETLSLTLGGGVNTKVAGDGGRFREKYGVESPFMLYAGRKEEGKNTPLLIDYFQRYCSAKQMDLKLVLIGPGKAAIPAGLEGRIIDLGFIPPQDKYDACAAATCLCNPSVNESFSIVIMESWLCEVPVLVHASCDVTREHCIKGNAGLYFRDYDEFEACLDLYLGDPPLRKRMGANGRNYVLENFAWDAVVKRYERFFKSLEGA